MEINQFTFFHVHLVFFIKFNILICIFSFNKRNHSTWDSSSSKSATCFLRAFNVVLSDFILLRPKLLSRLWNTSWRCVKFCTKLTLYNKYFAFLSSLISFAWKMLKKLETQKHNNNNNLKILLTNFLHAVPPAS